MADSQSSSFDESTASQNSGPLAPSSDVLRLSQTNHPPSQTTPSTSFSNPSSQDPPVGDPINFHDLSALRTKGQHDLRAEPLSWSMPHSESPPNRSPTPQDDRKASNKRMANGEVKHAAQNTQNSPVNQERHPRNTSFASRGSQIGELSNQLRTRLSYAMVKVQNGWQAHSFDELESLSQQTSPISAVSEMRRSFESPQSNVTDVQIDRAVFTNSSERSTAILDSSQSTPHICSGASTFDYSSSQIVDPAHPTRTSMVGPTYESFWKEHSASNVLKHAQTRSPPPGGPSLAPPVDILPRSRRRSNSLRTQPPSIDTRSHSHYNGRGNRATASNLVTELTTPPKKSSPLRTPSQKAAMEQDAVETLLFMSSPGNSGHQSQARSLRTPLRSNFVPLEKRVGFANVSWGDNGSDEDQRSIRPFQSHRGFLKPKGPVSADDVDRLLDEMPEKDSSSEDEDLSGQQ